MISQLGVDFDATSTFPRWAPPADCSAIMSVRRAMVNVEGQSREDQDVTMPAILQAAQQFKQDTMLRLGDVRQRQYSDWPIHTSNF